MDLKNLGIESNSKMYNGENKELSLFRQLIVNSGYKIFCVLNYSENSDIKEKISQSFGNIEKKVLWDDHLKDNDNIMTQAFKSHLNVMSDKYDFIFVNIPDKNSFCAISSVVDENENGVLVIIDSGKTNVSTLKSDLDNVEHEKIYTLIVK